MHCSAESYPSGYDDNRIGIVGHHRSQRGEQILVAERLTIHLCENKIKQRLQLSLSSTVTNLATYVRYWAANSKS
jgi:hypothetical protein